jgi:hypothetical protein
MKTARLVDSIEAVLRASLNTRIAVEALSTGKTIAPVAEFSQGFEDPMRLTKYNACLICPDQVRVERGAALSRLSLDLVFAISGRSKAVVMAAMQVYGDAVANLVEADPTLGGAAFETRFESAEYAGPTPGNGLIGVLIVRLNVDADDLLQ